MNKFGSFLGALLGGVALVTFAVFLVRYDAKTGLGSVTQSNEYNSTTTLQNSKLIYNLTNNTEARPGTLGSVIITSPGAAIQLIDATTTNPNLRAPELTSTTIALGYIPAEAPAGVYTFDTFFKYGLQVVFGSTDVPTSTVTFR